MNTSTLIGTGAILIWSTLAIFTIGAGNIPPFLLLAISFTVAFILGILWIWRAGNRAWRSLRQPWYVWAVSVCGLFGYHLFYFLALRHAPAVEANLINYLWPLLIVLLSALLPGEKMRWYHGAGAFLGFLGAGLLVAKGSVAWDNSHALGYMYALLCALTWSSYSVISRLFGKVPTSAVGGFCGAVMILSWSVHFGFEPSYIPTTSELFSAIILGLGPVGGAFYIWDIGMKHGDIRLLGTLAYAAPLLSTLLLIAFGFSNSTPSVWIACGLIIGGSLLSSASYWKKGRLK
jgi:drug/metabolite transporter (DMT)-like permease